MEPGSHGTTFGGHPVATAAGLAQPAILTNEGFLHFVAAKGEFLRVGLQNKSNHRATRLLQSHGRLFL